MNWIDIRIRKPTKADGDKDEYVLFLFDIGVVYRRHYSESTGLGKVAWMPIPPFDPPKIPEGWRVVDKETEKKRSGMQYWSIQLNKWEKTDSDQMHFTSGILYITPIEPQYRPFANAAEFRPFAQKEWRYTDDHQSVVRPPHVYANSGHGSISWEHSFSRKIFCDETPFGIKVE